MNKLSDAIGKLCEVLLPIPEEFYIGNTNSSICVCTLSSIKLLKELKNSKTIENVAIAGRLFTENKGIDSIIKYVNQNKKIKTIIVCGKEVLGHKSGHSLFQLHQTISQMRTVSLCSFVRLNKCSLRQMPEKGTSLS